MLEQLRITFEVQFSGFKELRFCRSENASKQAVGVLSKGIRENFKFLRANNDAQGFALFRRGRVAVCGC